MSGPPYGMTVIGLGAGFMLSHARYCVWEGSVTMAASRLISLPVSGLAVLLLPVMLSLGGCASPDDGETKTYYPERAPTAPIILLLAEKAQASSAAVASMSDRKSVE